MLDNDLQFNKQPVYGMQSGLSDGIPMQAGIEAEALKKSVDNSYLSKRVKQSEENSALLPAATLATWYGISQGMDVFNRKCNLDYEKTPMGRFGALGDKITARIKGSTLAQSGFGKGVAKAYNKTTTALSNFLNRSAMVRAFKNTPSQPTNKFVLPQAKGLWGWFTQDTEQILSSFLKPAKSTFDLEQYGADKKFINNLKQAMKAKGADKFALLKEAEMKLLGIPQADIDRYIQGGKVINARRVEILLRNAKIGKLGFTPREYKAVAKDFLNNSDKILAALEKAAKNNGDMFINRMRSGGVFGIIPNHLFGRKVGLRELYNKALVTLGKQNPKHTSTLGKGMAKAMGLFMEGTTNRFAGGKFAVLMQAMIFGDMIVNTLKAPKGEKGKTFAERFTNDFAYFLCAPFGLQLFHKLAGAGLYAGMSKDEVAQWRADVKDFNKRVMAGQLPRKGDYLNEKEALLNRLRAGRKNIFSKLYGRAAEIADVGLEQLRGYHKKAVKPGIWGAIKDFFTHPKYYWKNLAGYPMRLILIMGLIMPPLAKAATKVSHLIFGKPTHSVLDDDEPTDEEKQKQEMEALLEQLEAQKQVQIAQQQTQQPVVHNSPTNLLNQYVDRQTQAAIAQAQQTAAQQTAAGAQQTANTAQQAVNTAQQTATQQVQAMNSPNPPSGMGQNPDMSAGNTSQLASQNHDTNTYVPSPVSTIQNSAEPVRTYVPSPTPVVLQAPDTSKADAALMNADAAEKLARQTLSMR